MCGLGRGNNAPHAPPVYGAAFGGTHNAKPMQPALAGRCEGMSRPIPWTSSTPEEVQNIISYGLSVLPEAIDVYSHELKIKENTL